MKNNKIIVRVSDDELSKIKEKALKLGMPVSSFLRYLGNKEAVI